MSPAISFAKEMLVGKKNVLIGLIPRAWGGSPIQVWEPGACTWKTAHPYDGAIRRARLAMQKGVIKGILWHQGESDNNSLHAAQYMSKLKVLISRIRNDLHQPDIPFVAGEIGCYNKVNFINRVVRQLPQQEPHTAVVSASGLMPNRDTLYFNTVSARELGKRYAKAMKSLQHAPAALPVNYL